MMLTGQRLGGTRPKRPRFSASIETLEGRALLAASASSTLLNQSLVAEDYLVFLHRLPQASEVTGWTDQIAAGVGAKTIALRIAGSPEAYTDDVTNAYETYLGRVPSSSEVNGWVGQLQRGTTTDQLKSDILGSPEFSTLAGGTTQGFLSAVYTAVLGRAIDPAALTLWGDQLAAGTSRTAVAYDIVTSREAATIEVDGDYAIFSQTLVTPGRAPDVAGSSFWVALRSGSPPKLTAQVVAADFLASAQNIGFLSNAIATGFLDAIPLLIYPPIRTANASFALTPAVLPLFIAAPGSSTTVPASATFTVTNTDPYVPLVFRPVVNMSADPFFNEFNPNGPVLPADAVNIADPNGNPVNGLATLQPGQSETFTVTINPQLAPQNFVGNEAEISLVNGAGINLVHDTGPDWIDIGFEFYAPPTTS